MQLPVAIIGGDNRAGAHPLFEIGALNAADFLSRFRPDITTAATLGLISVDGGLNTQTRSDAGIEAVRASPFQCTS